jgi:HD-GYP domain-containing protein (c-di-GMP phosphodiesterase class II)/DNA-binding LacI/PurR family transcriptional regulator
MAPANGDRKRIGILCNHLGGATRPLENEAARAFADVADERDAEIVFLPGRFYRTAAAPFRDQFFGNAAAAACADGFVVLSSVLSRYLHGFDYAAFERSLGGKPLVCIGMALGNAPSVFTDNREAVRRAVRHLADEHGARRIAFIRGVDGNTEAEDRFAGYRAALAELGLDYDPALVATGNFLLAGGAEAVHELYARPGFAVDAIVAANDESALGAMGALALRGLRCPEDVRVVGFDDIEAAGLAAPPLSTIRQDFYGMARRACEILCDRLEGRAVAAASYLPSKFVPRGSCGCREAFGAGPAMPAALSGCLPQVGQRHRAFLEAKCAELASALSSGPAAEEVLARTLAETEAAGLDPILWLKPLEASSALPPAAPGESGGREAFFAGLARAVNGYAANARKRAANRRDRYDFILAEISQALIGARSLARIGEILAANLASLDLDFCLIALSASPAPGGAGLRPGVIAGRTDWAEFPPEDRTSVGRAIAGYGAPRIRIAEMLTLREEYYGVAVFGMDKPRGQITALLCMHISGALGAIRDFEEGERKRAAIEALNRDYVKQLRRLSALRAIDTAIAGDRAGDETLAVLLEQTRTQLDADAASILLAVDGGSRLEFSAGRGFRTEALQHTKLRIGEGYAGEAALGRSVVLVPDLGQSPKDFGRAPLLREEGFSAYCAAPLYARGVLMGVLEIFNRTPLHPDREWTEFLEALAGQAAIALDNRALIRGLRQANIDQLQAYDETIEGWSRALDLRDHETKGHSIRVAAKTVELGRRLGLGEAELALMYRGALLHDIGKVGIPDAILLKPGPLDEAESAVMRRHPQYAYDLLFPIAYLRPVIDIPYCHHEKWDGSGYPRGLSGTDIPLPARVFALVDVWDALTTVRPYREAWTEPAALAYMAERGGEHFDPDILKLFLP